MYSNILTQSIFIKSSKEKAYDVTVTQPEEGGTNLSFSNRN